MHLTDLKTAVLSDSFIASVPFKRASFNKILRFIFVVQYMLLQEGIIARGAIAIGNLYHENNIVFGPALVNAYLLQEHNAIFPRTIIDEETLKICLGTTASAVDRKTTYNKFKKDSDGFWFYDFIGHDITLYGKEAAQKIHDTIQLNLMENNSTRVKAKYEWIKSQYNRALRELPPHQANDLQPFLFHDTPFLTEDGEFLQKG